MSSPTSSDRELAPATGVAAAPSAHEDSRQSWRVLAGTSLLLAFGVSTLFASTFPLFMVPLEQSQGWTRAEIAFSFTVATAVSWLGILAAGWLADHVRLARLAVAGVVLGALNLAAFAALGPSVWALYGLVAGLSLTTVGASPVVLSKLVQAWFVRRLGSAFGILFASSAFGMIIHPLLVTAVLERGGWRAAYLVMAGLHAIVGLVAIALLIRDPPAATRTARPASEARAPAVLPGLLRSRTWWVLAIWNFAFAFGTTAILVHLAAMMADRGAAPTRIAFTFSLLGVGLLVGNLLAGWLADRVAPRTLGWMLMLPPVAATVLLTQPALGAATAGALVLGLASGSDGSLSAFLARHYFGGAVFGQASASQAVATAVGGGIAPWISGLLRDATGDYDASLAMAAAAFLSAVAAALALPREGSAR